MSEPEQHPVALPLDEQPQAEQPKSRRTRSRKAQEQHEPEHASGAINDVLARAKERLGLNGQEGDEKPKIQAPDPHFFAEISLTEAKDGPKIHLGRSNRNRDMLIKFDVKPEGEIAELVFQALKDHGFRWNNAPQAWTAKIDQASRWRTHGQAEKIFEDIGNTLREANGLGPVEKMGIAVG